MLGGLIQDTLHRRHRQGARRRRHAGRRRALPLRHAHAAEDEPVIFLKPTVVRTAARRPRDHVRALRLPAGEQERQAPRAALVLARPDVPRAAAGQARDAGRRRRRRRPAAGAADRTAVDRYAAAAPPVAAIVVESAMAAATRSAATVARPGARRADSVRVRADARRARARRAKATRSSCCMRPDATVDGIAEIKRVLQRPLRHARRRRRAFAVELARAYNQGRRGARAMLATTSRARPISRG